MRGTKFRPEFIFALAAAVLLWGCGPGKTPSIGEAWAGPDELILHQDLEAKSAQTGSVRHGEHLEILGQRRRWYRVRSERGAEGWVDDRQLLDAAQMERLRALASEAEGAPSQGVATSFDTLNAHAEPNRMSPNVLQLNAGDKFEIVLHRVAVKGPMPKRKLIPLLPRVTPPARNTGKNSAIPAPEPPAAPAPPEDWLELSRDRELPPAREAAAAPARDDWTLIRTAANRTGWVLTSRLYLNLPDEVAKHAAGRRITAYFSLGKEKGPWLWTTTEALGRDYDFDAYRVVTWNARRNRYENAANKRDLRGFFPVRAKAGEYSLCLEDDDGQRTRRRYTVAGTLVRAAEAAPCEVRGETEVAATDTPAAIRVKTDAAPGLGQRALATVKGWFDAR